MWLMAGMGLKLETSHLHSHLSQTRCLEGTFFLSFSRRGEASIPPELSASPPFPQSILAAQSHLALTCSGLFLVSGCLQLPNWSPAPTSTLPDTWSRHRTCLSSSGVQAGLSHSAGRKAQFFSRGSLTKTVDALVWVQSGGIEEADRSKSLQEKVASEQDPEVLGDKQAVTGRKGV